MTRTTNSSDSRAGLFSVWLWWSALAAVSYLGLHEFTIAGLPAATPDAARGLMMKLAPLDTWHSVSLTAQYAAPGACVVLALLITLLRTVRRREIKTRSGDAREFLSGLDNREFDALLIEAFKLQGYQIAGSGAGIDMILRKDHETCLVHAKQWKVEKVGVQPLRDLFSLMTARGAASGIIVTTGRFSREAIRFAATHSLKLVEGATLLAMIKRAQAAVRSKDPAAPVPAVAAAATGPTASATSKTPLALATVKMPKTWPTSVPAVMIPVGDVVHDEQPHDGQSHEEIPHEEIPARRNFAQRRAARRRARRGNFSD